MNYPYTYSDLLNFVNRKIYGKQGMLISPRATINEGVREASVRVKLRSAKRNVPLVPSLFTDIYTYQSPADLEGTQLIDIDPQVKRSRDRFWRLTTLEEFQRRKTVDQNLVAFSDFVDQKVLMISAPVNDKQIVADPVSSADGWSGFGDGTDLVTDRDNFIRNDASVRWDINSNGGTTAGIERTLANVFDITDWLASGYAFYDVYIQSITGLTDLRLRLGSGSGDYFEYTATADAAGNSFSVGWNIVSFKLDSFTQTGSPDRIAIGYTALFMTKDTGKQNELDYRFNHLVLKRGEIHNVIYYSKFLWMGQDQTRKLDSTQDDDFIAISSHEFNIVANLCAAKAAYEVREGISFRRGVLSSAAQYEEEAVKAIERYQMRYPDESMIETSIVYDFDSLQRPVPSIDQV